MSDSEKTFVVTSTEQLWKGSTRRGFLKMLGVGGTIVLAPGLFQACDSYNQVAPTGTTGGSASLNLSNDIGILNYAYALEQLEAAFYTAVVGSAAFSSMTAEQKEVMNDLRNHEVIHREFLKAALGTSAIGALSFNSAAVASTLTSPAVILKNAEAFEDLGVSAYNGAGKYLKDAGYLTLAGKIVSVEARHAAAIRDIRDALGGVTGTPAGTRFAGDDIIPATGATAGLDVKLEPSAVLSRVGATGLLNTMVSIGTGPSGTATPDAGPPSPTP
ncbi:MAG: ferritin-like domain-containing protein [Gemmatimonadota bacterium]|nr:ferritin-like domain-containing protein [Gemmatimonadota bacterium]